jgi:uncharacterized protein (TIGR02145 family)
MNKVICVLAAVVAMVGCVTAQTFTDPRDGKTYRTVKIDEQVWMAENLNFETDSSWCYGNDTANCAKYGRLYTWDAAMKACPVGWHLPSREEWDKLVAFVGGIDLAGTKLKSKSPSWKGKDYYGFSALPGGERIDDGSFNYLGSDGYWWTATESDASFAWYWNVGTGYANVGEYSFHKNNGFSVRCLLD